MSAPTADDVFIALCQLASGHNREKALTLVNSYLETYTSPIPEQEMPPDEEPAPDEEDN